MRGFKASPQAPIYFLFDLNISPDLTVDDVFSPKYDVVSPMRCLFGKRRLADVLAAYALRPTKSTTESLHELTTGCGGGDPSRNQHQGLSLAARITDYFLFSEKD
jgi:hypothetical protein